MGDPSSGSGHTLFNLILGIGVRSPSEGRCDRVISCDLNFVYSVASTVPL
jgi:hypothetical protein